METRQTGPELRLSAADIDRAVRDGVISLEDGERLLKWGYSQRFEPFPDTPDRPAEQAKGFNLVTVAYYFGAMLMIGGCAWFLGDKWDVLGTGGVLGTALIYATVAASLGLWLRTKGFVVGGGLLVTVAVTLVPLIVYSIQKLFGIWPADDPGGYENYYAWINGSWIVVELATITVAAIALYFVRFGFLTAPLAFSFWFLSMDVAGLIFREASLTGEKRQWISVVVGLITLFVGYALDKAFGEPEKLKSQDYAFWCYLFGTMAFWGGLTSMHGDSELSKAGYAFVNLCLIGVAIALRRTVFLVFGAIGVHIYLGHLAYRVFQDSFFFPFVIAFLGLSLILVTVLAQRYLVKRAEGMVR